VGLAEEIADETVARNRYDVAARKLIKLANRLAFQFDAMVLVGHRVRGHADPGRSAAWSGASPRRSSTCSSGWRSPTP
jgi:hypothetical protein